MLAAYLFNSVAVLCFLMLNSFLPSALGFLLMRIKELVFIRFVFYLNLIKISNFIIMGSLSNLSSLIFVNYQNCKINSILKAIFAHLSQLYFYQMK